MREKDRSSEGESERDENRKTLIEKEGEIKRES